MELGADSTRSGRTDVICNGQDKRTMKHSPLQSYRLAMLSCPYPAVETAYLASVSFPAELDPSRVGSEFRVSLSRRYRDDASMRYSGIDSKHSNNSRVSRMKATETKTNF